LPKQKVSITQAVWKGKGALNPYYA